MSKQRISEKGLEFIARYEGYRRFPYNDAANNATIGYGHLLHAGPVTFRDRLGRGVGLSQKGALSLLRQDASIAEKGVQRLVTRPLGQGQFDALCSFAFNCGVAGFKRSTLLRLVNQQLGGSGAPTIRKAFEMWRYAGGKELAGLRRRRDAEADLYLYGRYEDL